ncbi:hypothetical protein [Arenibacter sp. ARW7G5Y1]|uniref:hypothetical protein n=1 Tax=Arenibacter sp. ARW7G5Y1 TaxID=2135619 RepID=UPI000D7511F1|nr:hypothetical protein [Arenibacter sp. ARW7G5Y1]PXX25625.1 hypothetical protein C7972_11141 [Arenibacter sp. ARW7G5Y1]|tara:strand:+ start:168 stop:764 length:597 start_codon:yes stop_codon:yes gene_type:complete
MAFRLSLLLFILVNGLFSQENKIDWAPYHKFEIEDFKGSKTKISAEIDKVFVQSGVMLDFSFQMSNVEFMFTRNFNSKVSCTFQRDAAVIMAPDSLAAERLIALVQFDFDLSELYARKIRKELFENKKTFSDASFFQPYFDKMIAERNKISSRVYLETDFGNKAETLEKEHEVVKNELVLLSDFCKECKPPKKRNKTN